MKATRGYTMIEVLLGIVILTIAGLLAYVYFADDTSEPPKVATAGDVLSGRIHIVCVEGYEYFYTQSRVQGYSRAALAPLFDEEGRPRKCRAEQTGD